MKLLWSTLLAAAITLAAAACGPTSSTPGAGSTGPSGGGDEVGTGTTRMSAEQCNELWAHTQGAGMDTGNTEAEFLAECMSEDVPQGFFDCAMAAGTWDAVRACGGAE